MDRLNTLIFLFENSVLDPPDPAFLLRLIEQQWRRVLN